MLKYRPDIDGLRAIAVGSVVLYHLQESLLPGGFVGVDIFFVISGYLITKLIHSELVETGSFSFKRFYMRRVRRLFPALLATLILCVVLAYWLFSPAHLIEFAQSLIASVASVSNVFFWSLTDYFDSDNSFKPLLHTWSLSVEEQFYLIWPALLVWLFAFRKKPLIPLFIVGMSIASLLLNLAVFQEDSFLLSWFESPDEPSSIDAASTAFYWLPFRVFEFAIGAILVWLGSATRPIFAETVFAIGLAMVFLSFFTLDSTMEFPSTAALLPCVGAALMIYSGASHRLSGLVANRVMVDIGLMSYSLYLIHWPLIVFYKYWTGRELLDPEIVWMIGVSALLAGLMHRYIEQPFRKPKTVESTSAAKPNRPFLLASAAAAIVTVVVGISAITSKGWLWRYPADRIAQLSYQKGDYTEFFWANIKRLENQYADNNKPKVLIIGDSMAADLVNVMVAANAGEQLDIATVSINDNCKSLFGFTERQYQRLYRGAAKRCQREHARVLAKEDLFQQADTIVLASHLWDLNQIDQVSNTVEYLKTISDATIMVLGLKVQLNDGMLFLSKHAFSLQAHLIRTPPHPQTRRNNRLLRIRAEDYVYFDLLDGFCNLEGCQRVTKDGYVIIFDESHLSENGAKFVAKEIKETDWYQQMLMQAADTNE